MQPHDHAYYRLRTSVVILKSTMWAQLLFIIYLVTCTVVPGFGFYDADPPASFHAISHCGFWAAIEIFVLFIGATAMLFDLATYEEGLILSLKGKNEFMTFWLILLFFAIAGNIVHIVAASLELSDCRSSLCLYHSGFLIVLIILLGGLIVIEVLQMYNIYVLKKRIKASRKNLTVYKKKHQ